MPPILQKITVPYEYPVYFTVDVFEPGNPDLVEALTRKEPSRRHRMLVVVERAVAEAWPGLAATVARYADRHADRLELVAPPWIVEGGEAVKNDPAPLLALQTVPPRAPARPAVLRDRRRRRRPPRRRGVRRGDRAPGDPDRAAPDHGAGPGRLGGGRQERRQRVRREELPRHVRPAVRRPQRPPVPGEPRTAGHARGHGGGGEGGADPRPGVLRVAGRARGRAGRVRARRGGGADPPRGGASPRAHRHVGRPVRGGERAAPRLRALGRSPARVADPEPAPPRRGGRDRYRARHALLARGGAALRGGGRARARAARRGSGSRAGTRRSSFATPPAGRWSWTGSRSSASTWAAS